MPPLHRAKCGSDSRDALVADQLELAIVRRQANALDPFDLALPLETVLHELGDGGDPQPVLLTELQQLRDSGHRAVLVHDLADDPGRFESRQAGQIDGAFGLAGADQDAAAAGTQRENMARPRQVLGLGVVRNRHPNGMGAVGGADAGADALGRIDADGERRAEASGVFQRLRIQAQRVASLRRQRQTDQAPAEFRHEVDQLRRNLFGRADQIPLIFPVFRIHQNYHLALPEVLKHLRNFTELLYRVLPCTESFSASPVHVYAISWLPDADLGCS